MHRATTTFLSLSLLIGLPLLGIIGAGLPLDQYLEFPPLTRYVAHPPFSWPFFILAAMLLLAVMAPFAMHAIRVAITRPARQQKRRPFPWWGWLGITMSGVAWILAWNRFSWFSALQAHTFTPLWFGYILVFNALTYRRTGRCLLLNQTRYFLWLFVVSAGFWWYFEYLNRFVQNWLYVGIADFSPAEYVIFATLPFATVLPAVLSTYHWLASFPRLNAGFNDTFPIQPRQPKHLAWLALVVAAAGLAAIGVWPNLLFPLLWLAPLLIISALQAVRNEPHIFSSVARGDWRPLWLPALAALISGFFWELWNSRSLAHWEYAVPYVQHWKVFEMPLLGYAGYLPFGIECLVIARLFSNTAWSRE